MNKGSTLYDYTRSAEELRVFELGETCSRVIQEYEMFNLQNDVYKMFGEWLLNEAKTGYEAMFTEKILNKFLKDKDLTKPGKVYIKAKKSDLQSCEKLRELTSSRCWDERWNGWGGFETDYAWYTLWKIAKAYNCQNGCVVVDAPSYLMYSGNVAIVLNWSKKAQDCISHDKWRDAAEEGESRFIYLFMGSGIGFLLGGLGCMALGEFFGIGELILSILLFAITCVTGIVYVTLVRSCKINLYMEMFASDFEAHCKKIEETRYSQYEI